jgi:hypothetical protein
MTDTNHGKIDSCAVLARTNAETAMLFILSEGKEYYDTLSKKQVVRLIRTASEALSRMDGDEL